MKRQLTAVLAALIVLALLAVTAAEKPLTLQEFVEQAAVPMAKENDTEAGVRGSYTPEQLAELVRILNENGFILEENCGIMQALGSGRGYAEQEFIMDICRLAFGGYLFTWTLEQQDWYNRLTADIGWVESYEPMLPGEDNMSYEEAEAFAFARLREIYTDLRPEDRTAYRLSRQFFRDPERDGRAVWLFELEPMDVEHGTYMITFEDRDPEGTLDWYADIPDWSVPYTGERVTDAFERAYAWTGKTWPQGVWQHLHELMLCAELDPKDLRYPEYRGYQLTTYPEPAEGEVTREEAVKAAKEATGIDRAVPDSCVLTEYEGDRAWLVGLLVFTGEEDDSADFYVAAVDSVSGTVKSVRKATGDDDVSIAYVPEAAYEKAREGRLRASDYIRLAAGAIRAEYPELDPLNPEEFEILDWGGARGRTIAFITRNTAHGNAYATVGMDGKTSDVSADTEAPDGDNLFERYCWIYGYFGEWEQETWVKLSRDTEALQPKGTEGKLVKTGRYPEEDSVNIGRGKAAELALKASGKRSGEINTCVLIGAEPHPVWKARVLADDAAEQVIELDAMTGEVLATDVFRTDFTPTYVLFSTEKNWRKTELETEGPVAIAAREAAYAYGDMWEDEPLREILDPEIYEVRQEGLTVRFIARWAGMKDYLVELDGDGYTVRCEQTDSAATEQRPEEPYPIEDF